MILGAFGSGKASKIDDNLWQGGYPIAGLRSEHIDVVVLCARELQPNDDDIVRYGVSPFEDIEGVEVFCCPLDDIDSGPTPEEKLAAFKTAQAIVERLEQGKRVLVTCQAGRNRSGLVNALVLVLWRGLSGAEATARIQFARALALTNRGFCEFLAKIPAKK